MLDKISLIATSPEIVLLVMACVIALVDLGVTSRMRSATYWLTMATLAVVAYFTADFALQDQTVYAFGAMVVTGTGAGATAGRLCGTATVDKVAYPPSSSR